MKSKFFLIAFFMFSSLIFVNAQSKDVKIGSTPAEESIGVYAPEEIKPDNPNPDDPNGKVVNAQKPLGQTNEKLSATKGKTAIPAQRKKIAKVNATKVGSSK